MNDKLTKKLQVLLTEGEVREVNRIILNDALENEARPISVSGFIRNLIKNELSNRTVEQRSYIKQNLKKCRNLEPGFQIFQIPDPKNVFLGLGTFWHVQ